MKRKIIGLCIFVVGIGIIIGTIYDVYRVNKSQKEIQSTIIQYIKDNEQKKSEIEDNVKEINEDNETVNIKNGVIGLISIPKIEVENVAIEEGMSKEVLGRSVGHFEDTAMPWQTGNFALGSHRNFPLNGYFLNIHELEKGDKITITTIKKKYIYEVCDNFKVNPSQTEILNPTSDSSITLVTCTPGGKERTVIKGKLISKENPK